MDENIFSTWCLPVLENRIGQEIKEFTIADLQRVATLSREFSELFTSLYYHSFNEISLGYIDKFLLPNRININHLESLVEARKMFSPEEVVYIIGRFVLNDSIKLTAYAENVNALFITVIKQEIVTVGLNSFKDRQKTLPWMVTAERASKVHHWNPGRTLYLPNRPSKPSSG